MKPAVFLFLMAFVAAIALMVIGPLAGQSAEEHTNLTPEVSQPPTPRPFIGPVKRTSATVSVLPQRDDLYLVIDISDQRLYEMKNGKVDGKPIKVSTGLPGRHATSIGTFTIKYRRGYWHNSSLYPSVRPNMYKPMYFNGAQAIHGTWESNYDLLGTRASHGCVRTKQDTQDRLYDKYPNGTTVIVRA